MMPSSIPIPLPDGLNAELPRFIKVRQRFNDEREWYFNARRLDAVRLFADMHPVRLEASVSRAVFDRSRNLRDQDLTNLIVNADYRVTKEIDLQAYFVNREDRRSGAAGRAGGLPGRA